MGVDCDETLFVSGVSRRGNATIVSIEEEEMPDMSVLLSGNDTFVNDQEVLSRDLDKCFDANKQVCQRCSFDFETKFADSWFGYSG